ncbi:hypothetical protein CEQ90_12275 [Lewinellaceae bacterium SD302]|nr:hypothetical protein CEQ90_12275 [Lewinellaceae bacterium SD302]
MLLVSSGWLLTGGNKRNPPTVADGGKAAYRNYFLGNYYFREAQIPRATGYFRKAYQAGPDRTNFALAYALCLAMTQKTTLALEVLGAARRTIPPLHPDYKLQLRDFNYAKAVIASLAGRYASAQSSLNYAIAAEQQLSASELDPERLGGMYTLLGYLDIMSQEAPRKHSGLAPHVHLQQRELRAAFEHLSRALSYDSDREDARQNLEILADTLQLEITIEEYEAPVPDYQELGVYRTTDYPHLPQRMEGILPFGRYDEVLYLVDISGSMVMENIGCLAADRFTVMKEAATYLLQFTPDSTISGLATIGGDCTQDPDWWISTDSISRRELRWEIEHLNSNGTTPLLTTLVKAPELFSENNRSRKSIFFVSDGENVCSVPGLDICDWAGRLEEKNITLNVLTFLDQGLNNSGAFAEYACLADRSGGQVRYLDPLTCSIDNVGFDLLDQIEFPLPNFEKVNCWGGAVEKLWAIYPE